MPSIARYWGSKPGPLISDVISEYVPLDGVVLDPFGGSGSIILEVLRQKRKGIYVDVNPYAFVIAYSSLSKVVGPKLIQIASRITSEVKEHLGDLYVLPCPLHGVQKVYMYEWIGKQCTAKLTCGCNVKSSDIQIPRSFSYPDGDLKYPDGRRFWKKRNVDSVGQLFTKRNLAILTMLHSILLRNVENLSPNLSIPLITAFAAILFRSSKMARRRAGGWGVNSYWVPHFHVELNPLMLFKRAVRRLARKEGGFKVSLIHGALDSCDAVMFLRSALSLDEALKDYEVDAIVTDPPFTDEIQYYELSYMINIWIKDLLKEALKGVLSRIVIRFYRSEVVVNPIRGHTIETYIRRLYKAIKQANARLKRGGHFVLLFHEEDAHLHMEVKKIMERLDLVRVDEKEKLMKQRNIGCRDSRRGKLLKVYVYRKIKP